MQIKLTNYADITLRRLKLAKRQPRTVRVRALVDTGATGLHLKPSVVKKLGLARMDAVRPQTSNGEAIRFRCAPVDIELLDRHDVVSVIEVPENVPNLLGQVPLEVLDLVVDPKRQRVIPNPEHGGEQIFEEY